MKYVYNVERIHIPAHGGLADKPLDGREVEGRRIVHIFGPAEARTAGGNGQVYEVLTEIAL